MKMSQAYERMRGVKIAIGRAEVYRIERKSHGNCCVTRSIAPPSIPRGWNHI